MGPKGFNKKRAVEEIPRSFDTWPRKKQMVSSTLFRQPKTESIPNSVKSQDVIDLCDDELPMAYATPVPPVTVCKKLVRPLHTFPRFSDGDVYIELRYLSVPHCYQLHRGNLAWNSSAGFRNEISKPWNDLDNAAARKMTAKTGISTRFELFMDPELDLEILRRTNLIILTDEIPLQAESQESEKQPVTVAKPACTEPVGNHTHETCKGSNTLSTVRCQSVSPGPSRDKLSGSPARSAASMTTENKHINIETCETTILKPKAVAAVTNTEIEELKLEILGLPVIHVDNETNPKFVVVGLAKEDTPHIDTENKTCQTAMSMMRDETPDIKSETMRLDQALPDRISSQAVVQVNLAKSDIHMPTEIDKNPNTIVSMIEHAIADSNTEATNIKVVPEVGDSQACIETGRVEMQVDIVTGNILLPVKIETNGSIPAPNKEDSTGINSQIKMDLEEIDAVVKNTGIEILQTGDYGGLKKKMESRKQGYPADEQTGKVRIAKPKQDILDAYHNLFLIYYTKAPIISKTEIGTAIEQIELLIRVAEACHSLEAVIPYIESAVFKFSRELPKAILSDPPRWLLLSVKIKSAHIYRAAMVHIAGSYPVWPSSIFTEDHLPIRIIQFIERAQNKTALLKSEVDKKLFCNTIMSKNEKFMPAVDDEHNMDDAWFVVQMWRDWFSKAMVHASKVQKPYTENEDGKVYRLIAQGGDAYLPFDMVVTKLVASRMDKWKLDKINQMEVRNVLTILKKQAQEIVTPLCANHSLLSVEEAGIKYLTCHEIEDNDLPWILLPHEFA